MIAKLFRQAFAAGRHRTLLGLITVFIPAAAIAQDNHWVSSGGGKWEDGTKWSQGVPPNINHDVVIANGISGPPLFGSVLLDSTSASIPGNMVVARLRVGSGGGVFAQDDVLNLFNAGTTPLTILDAAVVTNRGILTIAGSTLDARTGLAVKGGSVVLNANSVLNVAGITSPAYTFSIDGSVTINAGLLTVTNDNSSGVAIGNLGAGNLTQLGGTWQMGGDAQLYVGGNTDSVGTVTISGGTAKLEGGNYLEVGYAPGSTGSVLVTGGELVTKNIVIGRDGVGQMTVSNGTWRMNGLSVSVGRSFGASGQGTLTIAGGTNVFSYEGGSPFNQLNVGGTGSLLVNGGLLVLTNHFIANDGFCAISNGLLRVTEIDTPYSGFETNSHLVFAGGTTLVSLSLRCGSFGCGSPSDLVTVSGGNLIVTNETANATLLVQGGTFRLEGGKVIVDRIIMTSPCARFERTGGTLIYKTAELDPASDADGDGLPNGYEESLGYDPLNPADVGIDTDGDGTRDSEEILAGTNPTNSASQLRIRSLIRQGDDIRIRWTTAGGKTNAIQAAQTLPSGSNTFVDLAYIPIPGTGDKTNTYVDVDAVKLAPSRFYRILLVK